MLKTEDWGLIAYDQALAQQLSKVKELEALLLVSRCDDEFREAQSLLAIVSTVASKIANARSIKL